MKKQVIQFTAADGGYVMVEATAVEPQILQEGGPQPAGRLEEITKKAVKNFEETLGPIKVVADSILAQLRRLSELPQEVQVEFGLKTSINANLVVAAGNLEANYKITLKWTRAHLTSGK
jgi:hypothetical protein